MRRRITTPTDRSSSSKNNRPILIITVRLGRNNRNIRRCNNNNNNSLRHIINKATVVRHLPDHRTDTPLRRPSTATRRRPITGRHSGFIQVK